MRPTSSNLHPAERIPPVSTAVTMDPTDNTTPHERIRQSDDPAADIEAWVHEHFDNAIDSNTTAGDLMRRALYALDLALGHPATDHEMDLCIRACQRVWFDHPQPERPRFTWTVYDREII